ncbi:MAG: sensor histidine kinase [Butyrivibrio sp.]
MLKRLRIKFIVINMSIVTIMLVAIFALIFYSTSRNLERESLQMMSSIAINPMQLGSPNESHDDVRLPYFCVLLNRVGEPLSVGGGYFDLSDSEMMMDFVEATYEKHTQSGVLEEYNLRFFCTETPRGHCIVFADMTSEQSTLKHLVENLILIGIIVFCVFLVISVFLARWVVKPVDLAWKQQKQFVADAAHELKTPLTVIMANAELLGMPECEENERQQFTGSILVMSKQMRGLVEKMLDLARIDNGSLQKKLGSVRLDEVVSDAILAFEPLFFEKGMALTSEIEPDIVVKGNPEHLKQLTDILLDNAQKYASPGGNIKVIVGRSTHNRCILRVSNQGEEISPQDLKDIFKRFYRVDEARAMNHSYGLGLAIAQGIVNEHNGRIWAESRDGYNSFFVELPIRNRM